MSPKRIVVGTLLAHPAAWPSERIALVVDYMKTWIKARSNAHVNLVPNVIPGRLEWGKNYHEGMKVEDWVDDTLNRKSPALGTHRYHMVLVPGRTCGKITAVLVLHGLQHPKLKVRALVGGESGPEVREVTGIRADDPEDWKAGWTLLLGDLA